VRWMLAIRTGATISDIDALSEDRYPRSVPSEQELGPLFYQPDPERSNWIMGKCERLERRGPNHFVIVGKTLDGQPAEARLSSERFGERGLA
jgi:hypothetical protein